MANHVVPTPATITHPEYDLLSSDWNKFRLTYAGGEAFRDEYLKTFSSREDPSEFAARKNSTYVPAHAKAAVNDVKNAIFQRMIDIARKGGPESYEVAITGNKGGVDLAGNSMDSFIGRLVLPELLSMAKVGIYVDKPRLDEGADLHTQRNVRPYLYMYKVEDIRSWVINDQNQLVSLLLRDHREQIDDQYGLVVEEIEEYRLLKLTENGVTVQFFDDAGVEDTTRQVVLNLTQIPFVLGEIGTSLLTDTADYQIALMNLSSSDMNYAFKSNFTFYTEQYNPTADIMQHRQSDASDATSKPGTAAEAKKARDKEIKVGATKGRRYSKGLDRPGFIHPSSEPLNASMEKQEKMKQEIRQLINLAITNIEPRRASAESKQLDERGLEAGLSYIGLELEYMEREVARIWAQYENRRSPNPATIQYPKKYSLKTDEDRRKEAKELTKQAAEVPSKKYQKETMKEVADITIGFKVSSEDLLTIHKEIDSADVVIMNGETIRQDVEAGLLSKETGSKARLYPANEVKKAAEEHIARLEAIAISQSKDGGVIKDPAARGVEDLDGDGKAGASADK